MCHQNIYCNANVGFRDEAETIGRSDMGRKADIAERLIIYLMLRGRALRSALSRKRTLEHSDKYNHQIKNLIVAIKAVMNKIPKTQTDNNPYFRSKTVAMISNKSLTIIWIMPI